MAVNTMEWLYVAVVMRRYERYTDALDEIAFSADSLVPPCVTAKVKPFIALYCGCVSAHGRQWKMTEESLCCGRGRWCAKQLLFQPEHAAGRLCWRFSVGG